MSIAKDSWPVPRSSVRKVIICCFIPILAEGYDVGVLGAILPTLANYGPWGLSPLELGALGSWALVGMLIGAMCIGSLSDRYGRKLMLATSVVLFAGAQIGVALAPTPEVFGLFRLIGGLGMGGIIPVCAALTIEFSPPERRSFNYGLMYSGYSLGILASGLSALLLIEHFGWRVVVAVGAVPILILPLLLRAIPESQSFLLARRRGADAEANASRLKIAPYRIEDWQPAPKSDGSSYSVLDSIKVMFSGKYVIGTIAFWISLFCGLLLVYGLNTWLPSLMRSAGYDLGSSLTFLIVFSLASAIGGLVIGAIGDKWGKKTCLVVFYLLGACGILLLMFPNHILVNYAFVSLAGVGSISTSLVLTGWVADYYPSYARGTATGWALSFARVGAIAGPLLGGWIGSAQLPFQWNFIIFAVIGALAALGVLAIPQRPKESTAPAPHEVLVRD
ncbi:MFS transporter, AAHS family, benzoate transport protein [Brevibacterium sp. 239c]|uniref:MFS transporter n=1 Tax=Brevibacterium sp. 239c TaxID=1965356 RepID=UPI000C447515|nr:aromatic acid/H+ symport family MFS transporter [Brevibacterium sp. 239c]SMY04729.1 MFS transporter, AAHS family, benzoate transport protein [Brevibacterium sp. 239c]